MPAQKPMLYGSGLVSLVGSVPVTESYFLPSSLSLNLGS
jgi:hypothetical protein